MEEGEDQLVITPTIQVEVSVSWRDGKGRVPITSHIYMY